MSVLAYREVYAQRRVSHTRDPRELAWQRRSAAESTMLGLCGLLEEDGRFVELSVRRWEAEAGRGIEITIEVRVTSNMPLPAAEEYNARV